MVASDVAKRAVPCGSLSYWAIVLAVVPCAVATWLLARRALLAAPTEHWTPRTTIMYPLISTVAGLIAGMFGVGGGIVKVCCCDVCTTWIFVLGFVQRSAQGPLMLHLGMLPDVAAATSSAMVLMTSAASTIVFASFGALPLQQGWPCGVVAFVAALTGQLVLNALVRKSGRRSLVVVAMIAFMLTAAVVVLWQGGVLTKHAVASEHVWAVGTVCEPISAASLLQGGP